jgi:hypothetical protein
MSETKSYATDVVLSVGSGKMLCSSFGDIHELITDLAGWPVMTHHMANAELMDGVQAKVVRQVPWLPGAVENMPTFPGGEGAEAAVRAYTARMVSLYGETTELTVGDPLPTLGLLDGLAR